MPSIGREHPLASLSHSMLCRTVIDLFSLGALYVARAGLPRSDTSTRRRDPGSEHALRKTVGRAVESAEVGDICGAAGFTCVSIGMLSDGSWTRHDLSFLRMLPQGRVRHSGTEARNRMRRAQHGRAARSKQGENRVEASNVEELRILQDAAMNGDASAQTTLGLAYELGHGVERDPFHASHLYWTAALAGEVRAQFALGMLYEQATGADARPALARKWYELAARAGHVAASRRLTALGGVRNDRDALATAGTGSGSHVPVIGTERQ